MVTLRCKAGMLFWLLTWRVLRGGCDKVGTLGKGDASSVVVVMTPIEPLADSLRRGADGRACVPKHVSKRASVTAGERCGWSVVVDCAALASTESILPFRRNVVRLTLDSGRDLSSSATSWEQASMHILSYAVPGVVAGGEGIPLGT
jgi:hypothetical protein